MAWTQTDLDAIAAAILKLATGERVTSVTFSDRTVTFQSASLDDLLQLQAQISQAIAAAAGTPKNYRLAATSKGV